MALSIGIWYSELSGHLFAAGYTWMLRYDGGQATLTDMYIKRAREALEVGVQTRLLLQQHGTIKLCGHEGNSV